MKYLLCNNCGNNTFIYEEDDMNCIVKSKLEYNKNTNSYNIKAYCMNCNEEVELNNNSIETLYFSTPLHKFFGG